MLARLLRSFKSGERSTSPISEPIDLAGMTPEEVECQNEAKEIF